MQCTASQRVRFKYRLIDSFRGINKRTVSAMKIILLLAPLRILLVTTTNMSRAVIVSSICLFHCRSF